MPPLHRHQLVHLNDAGWRALLVAPHDEIERGCLEHWAAARLPLVVTRQLVYDDEWLHLALAAPLQWQRRRITGRVPMAHAAWFDEFGRIDQVLPLLQPRTRPAWQRLCDALAWLHATARVYGSHGWEQLSGLPCVRAGSDVDIWVAVEDTAHADAVASALARFAPLLPQRLDGELYFADGRAYAWREWQAWREGRARAILCRTLHDVSLEWRGGVCDAQPAVMPTLAFS